MANIIYLLIIIFGLYCFVRLCYYLDERIERKKQREERRRNARFFETIDYTNFNPKTGRYER